MPPAQCPECGRFLAAAFVRGLTTEPDECPGCDARLSPAHFPEELGQEPASPHHHAAAAATPGPDQPPDPVRGGGTDPLMGWDAATAGAGESFQPPPSEIAILVGTGAAGALIGAVVARRWARGACGGLLLGIAAAAAARQVWRAPV